MRKLTLTLIVVLVLAWIGWQQQTAPVAVPDVVDVPDAVDVPTGDVTGVGVRRDLRQDEASGGHTIARHVGRTDAQLRARLARESIAAASTYPDLETAERVVGMTLQQQASRVQRWTVGEGRRPNLVLQFSAPRGPPIGRVLRRGAQAPVETRSAVVVLRWQGNDYIVLTSYPETSRRGR